MAEGVLVIIFTISLLILVSAFFSASETSLTSISRAKIHKLKMEGNKRAALVSSLRHNKDTLISAILLGNNTVNTLAASITTSLLIKFFGDERGVFYSTVIVTLVVLLFGEILPKSYAFVHSEKVALAVAPLIELVVKLFSPALYMLNFISKILMKILFINISSPDAGMSGADALRGAIDLHHHEGAVVKQERDMLGSILDLADTEVGEVMVHRKNVVAISINQPVQKIIDQVLGSVFTRMPVWENNRDNIIGILNAKDLLKELNRSNWDLEKLDLRVVMQQPWFIPETITLKDQLVSFREKRNHFALVVDEYGGLLGVITLEDILEEIVGQIEDEHDHHFSGIMKQADGSHIVDGSVTVRDLNRQLDWNLPDEKAATIAGLIIEEAEIIPDTGEVFDFYNTRFEILKRNKNRLTKIRVKKI